MRKNSSNSTRKQKVTRRSGREEQPKTRYVAIAVVTVAAVAVAANVVLSLNFTAEKTTMRKMKEIAQDYYENYFYDNYTGKMSKEEVAEELSKMEKNGFPRTYLHDLLLFDNERHEKDAKEFKREGYTCDTNKTYAIFYPEKPYGRTDYRVEYEMKCE